MKRVQEIGYGIVFFALMALFVAGCSSKKRLPKSNVSAIERSTAEKIAAIQQNQISFNQLSIKAKSTINLDGNSNDVTINIRIANEEKIWLSVTAIAGLEVARMLITPDSIKIINRLESTYIRKPFSFIHGYTNSQVSFATLQSLLVGNVWAQIFAQKHEINPTDTQVRLIGDLSTIHYQLDFNQLLKLSVLSLEDRGAQQQLLVNYSDFYDEGGQQLPHQVKLSSLVGAKSVQAELKYTKVEKDILLDFPFSVPKRFSVKN